MCGDVSCPDVVFVLCGFNTAVSVIVWIVGDVSYPDCFVFVFCGSNPAVLVIVWIVGDVSCPDVFCFVLL
jgi:hypothetical protein